MTPPGGGASRVAAAECAAAGGGLRVNAGDWMMTGVDSSGSGMGVVKLTMTSSGPPSLLTFASTSFLTPSFSSRRKSSSVSTFAVKITSLATKVSE